MSDKELLEKAAKAAGYAVEIVEMGGDFVGRWLPGPQKKPGFIFWQPLRDHGDAMRLACDLRLTVYHDDLAVIVKHKRFSWEWMGEMVNEDNGNRHASACRAIVRAAAAMSEGGKQA